MAHACGRSTRIQVLWTQWIPSLGCNTSLRGDLGLGDYQVLSKDAIQRHHDLCGLAHLMLTHHSMDAVGAQAMKANQDVTLPSLSHRLEALRQLIRADQIRRLLNYEANTRRRQKIKQWLLAA